MSKDNNRKPRSGPKEVKEFEEEVIQIDRVTRVVKGGRRLRFRATVVIGNRKGKVGVGIGKSTEVVGAISKAINQAKKTMITVPMVGTTIPHRIKFKFKSARILLMPATPGTGIKAGGSVRKVVELAGIKDILSKCLGTNNRLNNSQCAILALASLKPLTWLKVKGPADVTIAAEDAAAVTAQENKAPKHEAKKEHAEAPKKSEPKSEPKVEAKAEEKTEPKSEAPENSSESPEQQSIL